MKILLIGLVFLYSCGNTNVNNTITKQNENSFDKANAQQCIFRITNSEIVKFILSIDVFVSDTSTIKNLFKTKPIMKIIKEKGVYDENEYSYFIFETTNTFVKLFRNIEGFYIEEALIKEDEIKLYKNCSIGMLKEDFCKQMAIEDTDCDTIIIVDEDQTLNLNFVFRNEHLRELRINASE